MRINIRFAFMENFKVFKQGIGSLRSVFDNIKFKARCIKSKNFRKERINQLIDCFRAIDHSLELEFNVWF